MLEYGERETSQLIVLNINVCREIGWLFLKIIKTWCHSGGRLAGPKWHHLGGS
jgi:hypothetical protein